MSTSSADSARQTAPKVEVKCGCGKRYRVAASKAGKKVRCKKCRLQLTVPGDAAAISLRTRKQILEELGIDAEGAEKAFEVEQQKGYTCALCALKIPADEVEGSYGGELGMVCGACRGASAAEAPAGGDEAEKKTKKKKQPLTTWSKQPTPEQAKRKGMAYGALFFVGIAGFVHNVIGPALPVTLLASAVAAAVGAHAVYKAHLPSPEPVKKA